ncbi:MAG TPA: amylo-alpha-1,6-glucosidase [Thermomicrobiales bacterium]|nr:amylo-alpha-1,6-glucosidase [Thermomicrobiales bacterium]
MSDVIQIDDAYYIRTTSSMADSRTMVLKHADTFGVFDRHGDIRPLGAAEQGIFHDGARFLSRLVLEINGEPPLLLSSTTSTDSEQLAIDLTNHDIRGEGARRIPQETLHILRSKFLLASCCFERVSVRNYGNRAREFALCLRFGADYADIFEIRGMTRGRHGEHLPARVDGEQVMLAYRGLDDVTRYTRLRFSPVPDRLEAERAEFLMRLEPNQATTLDVIVSCRYDERHVDDSYDAALESMRRARSSQREREVRIASPNQQFSDWVSQARADLRMLVTDTSHGAYPYAGVPWFSTAFGRDGVIAALQTLWLEPGIARGVLRFLAAYQARELDPEREAEPGKILHEMRRGEMAALGEIPFGLYYGSVDVTPLFVMLAGAYYRRTGDRNLIEALWPNIEAALRWIDTSGDVDGDGFIEYAQHNTRGLSHQGWKDSHDAIFHADGSEPAPPIALCEVQGYVYAARRAAAELARALGRDELAGTLLLDAERLRMAFHDTFWMDDLGTYALALDGDKRPCRVRSSNAGHCLYTGIADEAMAARLAQTLMDDAMFSGFGVRTIAVGEARYNPMSYHNGSVWPHDTAMIAAGLARYGYKEEALRVMSGLFAAGAFMDLKRLPELFCGFPRRQRVGPTLYPVACSPQAWAAGSVLMLLEACLGMDIDAPGRVIRFDRPILPDYVPELDISRLAVGDAVVDLAFHYHPDGVGVLVASRTEHVEVIVAK